MDELATSILGIDFPNKDKSKGSMRMERMLCALGDGEGSVIQPPSISIVLHQR